ncbi:hypothetical protein [Salinibacillus xinjiangensis]|uniref:Uncharacterized protein n=1 Tax=Salinibacillus xinjiangensis TaxID=1229268 RepID=A0A6G1X944_9BACI|nr:hypothetical protein [Salinibacillus xinjiangensis]MRG87426.1 hypothetical protein [Salinibacillus xinjiangensis]
MKVKEKLLNQKNTNVSVLTFSTDKKVPPAKYETGFKKVNSRSAKKHQHFYAKLRNLV